MSSDGYKSQLQNFVSGIRGAFKKLIGSSFEVSGPPKEGSPDMPDYVRQLWRDSRKWKQTSFNRLDRADPDKFFRDCRTLEQGRHWRVWDSRKAEPWQNEITDNEIGNQVRIKKSYLTANWHDVQILPNIKNASEYFDEERSKNGWAEALLQGVPSGLITGTAVFHTYFDPEGDDGAGLAKVTKLDLQSIYPTPFSTGILKEEGSTHLIIAELQNVELVVNQYPKLDGRDLNTAETDFITALGSDGSKSYRSGDFMYTKQIDMITVYIDDDTTEKTEFDQEEVDLEHAAVESGQPIEVHDDQNQAGHIEAHLKYLEGLQMRQEVDPQTASTITQYFQLHVQDHIEKVRELQAKGIDVGEHLKYPNGRKIVVVGGVVAEDAPVMYNQNWRMLFHIWHNERMENSWWGRGVPEALWDANYMLDSLASLIMDVGISIGMPKVYFQETDKDSIESQGLTNNPTEPGFVTGPVYIRQGSAPKEFFQLLNLKKEEVVKNQGISDVSYGRSPGAGVAAKLVQILLQQNIVIVTGEGNMRLNIVVERMVESFLNIWNQFYTAPKLSFITGTPKPVILADEIGLYQDESGQSHKVTSFKVSVRSNSNFPQQWEYDLAFLMQMANTAHPDGKTYLPREAVLAHAAKRFPQFAVGGPYYQMSEALAAGLQAMQQQQSMQKEEMSDLRKVSSKYKQAGMKTMFEGKPVIGGENGTSGPVPAN